MPEITLEQLDMILPADWRTPPQPASRSRRRPQGQGEMGGMRSGEERVQELVDGLIAAGYMVSRAGSGAFATTTALCHGGDSPRKLWISPGDTSPLLKCFTAECTSGPDGHREALDRLTRAAGLDVPERKRDRYLERGAGSERPVDTDERRWGPGGWDTRPRPAPEPEPVGQHENSRWPTAEPAPEPEPGPQMQGAAGDIMAHLAGA